MNSKRLEVINRINYDHGNQAKISGDIIEFFDDLYASEVKQLEDVGMRVHTMGVWIEHTFYNLKSFSSIDTIFFSEIDVIFDNKEEVAELLATHNDVRITKNVNVRGLFQGIQLLPDAISIYQRLCEIEEELNGHN